MESKQLGKPNSGLDFLVLVYLDNYLFNKLFF